MTSKKNIPKLRFPEYQDAGDWEEKKLGDASEYEQPTDYLVSSTNYDDSYKIPVLTAGKTFILGYTNETIGIYDKQLPVIIFDDFTTATQFVNFPFKAKSSAMKIITPKDGFDVKFIFEVLQSIKYELGVHGRNWISVFAEMKILFPTLPEQAKIADCLSSLDDLVSSENEKLEALKEHKKGLMQVLFPAAGEKVPKLRFPEFHDAGDWEEKTLGAVADYENGRAQENDITEIGQYVVVNSKFISTEGKTKKFSNYANCIAQINDILMVLSDLPNGKALAKCYLVESENLYAVNQRIARLTPQNVVNKMLYYVLNRNTYFLSFDDGVGQTNLRRDVVLNCPIILPNDFEEQTRIANFLSFLDDQIKAQTDRIEALKEHKKGLMQNLFPNLN